MKCPKCGYLGFDAVDRCRNCGYEFSLSSSPSPAGLELPLKSRDSAPLRPLDDVSLGHERSVASPSDVASAADELPLFGARASDDLPLIIRPSAPRTPLAVRRATPEVPRVRVTPPRLPTLDLSSDFQPSLTPSLLVPAVSRALADRRADQSVPDLAEDAHLGLRTLAVLIDLVILASVDALVVYFTMQVCGIGVADIAILPRVPLLAFLLVQNGGYLVAFTAGGQTLGKMVTGIKVVSTESRSSVDLGRAFVRALVWLVLALPAGLGLLTVLAADRRGVHDRFAGTRVVRSSL